MRLPSKCRSKWLSLLLPAAVLVNQSNLFCFSNAGGSLIHLQMRSTVGILLDETPAGFLREDAADHALRYENFFWIAKAQRQIRLANYRLVFRNGYYSEPKGPLPLP